MTSTPSRKAGQFAEFLRHMRARWFLYVPIFAVWGFAYARLFVDPTPRVPVLFNWTPSLPYSVAVMHYGPHDLQRGDYIVFAFAGEARTDYPGLGGQPFFKIVRGLPGDTVTVSGRTVAINGQVVGTAKTHAFDHAHGDPAGSLLRARHERRLLRLALSRQRSGARRAGAGHRGAAVLRGVR